MKIHFRALKGHPEAPFLALDIVVLLLITGNLLWLLLDAILLNTGIGVLIGRYFPTVLATYETRWHENLLIADSIFTLFLIAELLLRWGVAIYRKTYYRWFFYPFVHWYDVLGCIPLPPFRALRLLRLISIGYRLQKLGVVDFSQSSLVTVPYRYYRMIIEELSDRIVINVLEGVQREVRGGSYVSHRLADEVLRPHRDRIVPWLASLLSETGAYAHQRHREQLRGYLDGTVRHAIAVNPDIQKLRRRLLFAGPALEDELQRIVSGLLTQMIDDLLHDLGQPDNTALTDVAGGLFDTLTRPRETGDDDTLRQILLDALELVKKQVEVQQWKLRHEGILPGEQDQT